MLEKRHRISLPFVLIFAILAVSTASIFIRFAQSEAPSLVIAALRLTFASLILAPLAITRHRIELRKLTRRDFLLGQLSGLFLALHFATWITSLEYTSVASSVVLVSTGPLWVALLSPIFLNEPLTRNIMTGMSLALLGGTIIGLGDSCQLDNGLSCPALSDFLQGQAFFGNFLALAGAWAVAGYLMIGRKLRAGLSLIPYIFIVYGSAAITLLITMFLFGKKPSGYSPSIYIWILLLAIFPQLIGHTAYNWALRYMPVSMVSITTLAEPVSSAILAFAILNEVPNLLTAFGALLILAGIYLATRPKQYR